MYDVNARRMIDLHNGTVVRQAYPKDDPATLSRTSPEARLLKALQRALESEPPVPLQHADMSEKVPPLAARILGILQREHSADPMYQSSSDEAAIPPKEEWPKEGRQEIESVQAVADHSEHNWLGTEPRPARSPFLPALRSLVIIVSLTIAGLTAGVLLSAPSLHYTSKVSISAQQGTGMRAPSLQASLRKLESGALLSAAVVALKLDRDPDFTGGKATPWNVVMDLLWAYGGASDPASRAEAALREAVKAAVDDPSGRIVLAVTTSDARKSRTIAEYLADAVIKDAPLAKAGVDKVQSLRDAFEKAQTDLAEFRKHSGGDKIKAALDLEQQERELDTELAAADNALQLAREKAEAVKSAKLTDVLNGTLPPDLMSSALQGLRDRYVAAKAALIQLSTDLGPRHPRMLAQQVVVDDLRADIEKEIRRLAEAGEADLKAATGRQNELAARRVDLGGQAGKVGVDMAQLRQLEDRAQAARARLDEALQQTGRNDVKTIPTLTASSASPAAAVERGKIAPYAAGGLAGFEIGLGLVLLRRLFRSHHEPEVSETEPAILSRAADVPSDPLAALDRELKNVELDIRPSTARQENIELLRREMALLRMKMHSYAERREGNAA
ncbi:MULTISPECIES: hypothetical protein [unclassified Sinorhizobium]|uniref:hypothetical protein n=1 Tax=unclassified Sinorhizobium TaxID=2613772 RepID=UPI003524C02D